MARRTSSKKESKKASEKEIFKGENVQIEFRPYEDGNLLGFATLLLYDEEIKVYNCRVVEGKTGPFVSYPSYKGSDGNYYNIVYIDKDSDLASEIVEVLTEGLNNMK
jgi:DNA-binding cell septation regulator SpoVG